MKLFNKPLDEINIDDINMLIQDGVSESRTLDYKQELHPTTDSGNKEFLRDVSAFANTMGGCLIYGIEEEEGVPKAAKGVEVKDFDKFKLHCENLLRSGVDPVIRGVDFQAIDLADDKKVIIVGVPRSMSRPHVVKIKKHFNFYGRNSGGVHQLEVDDLRKAFLASETLATRIRGFRNERLSVIAVGDTPAPLKLEAKLVLHLIPVVSFELNTRVGFEKVDINELPPITHDSYGKRYNLDGLFISNEYSYAQLFKNGIIEAVDTFLLEPHPVDVSGGQPEKNISSHRFEKDLVQTVNKYFRLLDSLEIGPPVWICLSLLNVRGHWMYINRRSPGFHQEIDRDDVIAPEVLVEDLGKPGEEVLKPIFDCVWNACGIDRSHNYDENGNWKLTE